MESAKSYFGYMMILLVVSTWSVASRATNDLDLMTHDLMAQEAQLAEFGWEETVIEDGAILIRQGKEDYLPFLVRTEEAYPFVYHEDYYYMPPPIVVRRTGLRVSVNHAGKPFLYWPPIQVNMDDPGPPPSLGPGIPDENNQMPEDVQAYWLQKEVHLLKNYDFETACIMYYDCLKESSELSGGVWSVVGPSPKEQFYTSFQLQSNRLASIPNRRLSPPHSPPSAVEFLRMAMNEYDHAVGNCSNTQIIVLISPDRWGRLFYLGNPNADEDMAMMISDLPKEEKLAKLSQFFEPSIFPTIHSSPELAARLERARLEREAAEPEM